LHAGSSVGLDFPSWGIGQIVIGQIHLRVTFIYLFFLFFFVIERGTDARFAGLPGSDKDNAQGTL
jgi:hypothetical protein